ncbi:MAG: hypothetical protein A2114_01840 [Candidatus Vogelbacteria bacterium GWA1_51_14]|uniref:SMODS and SLOG-associating 2TM effector domain-containing protein n=1 Tax=Candidatus Vogelbacteria bacterium GWA1_51_14 TaxID=1802435 RepID=A0A1G2QAP7_9BACT|nr:MAG: hypothetical protein A2114_01840 [Candidatus Vogelbacteria bacterium GWA1_51_14]
MSRVSEMSDEDLASLLIETEKVRKNGWWQELTSEDGNYYLVTAGQWIARRKILSNLCGWTTTSIVFAVGLFGCSVISQDDNIIKIAAGAAIATVVSFLWVYWRVHLWKPYGNFHFIRLYLEDIEKLHRDILKWSDWQTSSILFGSTPGRVDLEVERVLKSMTLEVVRLEEDLQRVGSQISEQMVDDAKIRLLTSLKFAQDRMFTTETRGALFRWAEQELEAEKAADDIPI